MTRRGIGNSLAGVSAVVVGILTMVLSYTKLKQPQIPLDWVALAFTGFTTGIIAFFVIWGHFQDAPLPEKRDET